MTPKISNIEAYEEIPDKFSSLNSVRLSCAENVSGQCTDISDIWMCTEDNNSKNVNKKIFGLAPDAELGILEYHCSNKIRNGQFHCFWRVKLYHLAWRGNWRIGVDTAHFDETDPPQSEIESYKNDENGIYYQHWENHGLLAECCNYTFGCEAYKAIPNEYCFKNIFFYIYFGDIVLQSKDCVNNLQFSVTQKNYNWYMGIRGISFDCIELYEVNGLDSSSINELSLKLQIPQSIINIVLEFSGYYDFKLTAEEDE